MIASHPLNERQTSSPPKEEDQDVVYAKVLPDVMLSLGTQQSFLSKVLHFKGTIGRKHDLLSLVRKSWVISVQTRGRFDPISLPLYSSSVRRANLTIEEEEKEGKIGPNPLTSLSLHPLPFISPNDGCPASLSLSLFYPIFSLQRTGPPPPPSPNSP